MADLLPLLRPAQTNLALYEQLRQEPVQAAALARVRRAYELAMELFAGRYRSSGKTFVAHLVGTASILAGIGAHPEMVLAGLLHAAYNEDVWGGGRRRVTAARRAEVRAALGDAAEGLVFRYANFPWTDASRRGLAAAFDGLSALDRDVLTMRLCNELEDLVDLAPAYSGKAAPGEHEEELARRLGLPQLAAALAEARQTVAVAALPPELRSERKSSYLVAPRSHRRRVPHVLARALTGLLDRLRR